MKIICTIITPDHLYKAQSLFDSISLFDSDVSYHILTTDKVQVPNELIKLYSIQELSETDLMSKKIFEKYNTQFDELRWSLKPAFISYILKNNPEASVIYCDCDFCFFGSTSYLFNLVNTGSILLTPHWRPLDPIKSPINFKLNYRDGLFNAGCITANYKGLNALEWWGNACLSSCENNREQGLYHDQRYLDLMPIYFPETIICRHLGINIADWNLHQRDKLCPAGTVIETKWPITLIHFTKNTIKKIESGGDPTLESYLSAYKSLLEKYLQTVSLK